VRAAFIIERLALDLEAAGGSGELAGHSAADIDGTPVQ
jgi:hypothetical protein